MKNKINYDRPAIHRRYIKQGIMTKEESDKEIRDRKIREQRNKFDVVGNKINKIVNDMGLGIIEGAAKWEDLHGYQNDEGEWEI